MVGSDDMFSPRPLFGWPPHTKAAQVGGAALGLNDSVLSADPVRTATRTATHCVRGPGDQQLEHHGPTVGRPRTAGNKKNETKLGQEPPFSCHRWTEILFSS